MMDQPENNVVALNHSIAAIDTLRNESKYLLIAGADKSSIAVAWIADLLGVAQKFILPEGGRLLDVDPRRIGTEIPIELVRLPYPVVAIEYRMERGGVGNEGVASHQRIALAVDLNRVTVPEFMQPELNAIMDASGGVGIVSIFNVEIPTIDGMKEKWATSKVMAVVPNHQEKLGISMTSIERSVMNEAAEGACGKVNFVAPSFHAYVIPLEPELIKQVEEHMGVEKTSAMMQIDINDELRAAIDLGIALNCSNVDVLDVPASAALNKKRVKNGKLPFFNYKVLVIKTSKTLVEEAGETSGAIGRQSPRMHFRRGHIRRWGEGGQIKLIWVSPAVVGDASKGTIQKDYLCI